MWQFNLLCNEHCAYSIRTNWRADVFRTGKSSNKRGKFIDRDSPRDLVRWRQDRHGTNVGVCKSKEKFHLHSRLWRVLAVWKFHGDTVKFVRNTITDSIYLCRVCICLICWTLLMKAGGTITSPQIGSVEACRNGKRGRWWPKSKLFFSFVGFFFANAVEKHIFASWFCYGNFWAIH